MLEGDPEQAKLPDESPRRFPPRRFLAFGVSSALFLFMIGITVSRCTRDTGEARANAAVVEPTTRRLIAVRDKPDRFRANSYMPKRREGDTSGSIDLGSFSAGRDLVYIADPRVWWESDNDGGDTEDDHSIHRSIEDPLRRLIELVVRAGGTLKVQDAYRAAGVHNPRSLHKEGRALDLTCDELGLEELAKLCWMAGFDWVYHEANSKGGAHVHASVKRDRE